MKIKIFCAFAPLALMVTLRLSASTYYISPSGADDNAGTSTSAPWKTFGHAIPLLNAGDTLYLLNGTYTGANSGYPQINCSSGARNGTSFAPITIQALNERQAFIQGNGSSANPFYLTTCSYWNIVGLHVEDGDFSSQSSSSGGVIDIASSNHIVLRRNIAARANRYANAHVLLLYGTSNSTIEENELYYCHRWCLVLYGGSSNNEVRRNYANDRNYVNISGGYDNANFGGDFGPYNGSNNNLLENNILENQTTETAVNGFNNESTASNNQFLGNVNNATLTGTATTGVGFEVQPHLEDVAQPIGVVFTNNVSILAGEVSFWDRSGQATYDHNSAFGNSSAGAAYVSDDIGGLKTYPSYTFVVNNSTAQNFSAGTGFTVNNTSGNTFSFDHDNCSNDATCYNPNSHVTNPNTANPAFGSCYLWVPVTSPLKGAGSGGSDIGANVLYQYNGGVLGTTKLWDPTTGAPLFAGALVAGLNDVAGSSLFDIANRLNINKNGCSFPTGYATTVPPNPPTGLTAAAQ